VRGGDIGPKAADASDNCRSGMCVTNLPQNQARIEGINFQNVTEMSFPFFILKKRQLTERLWMKKQRDGDDMEILRTEHLIKRYGKGDNEVLAVDDVSLSVAKGEFVAVVGSSGSGKSTLMHMLGGVDRPTSGRVLIEDTDIYGMDDDRLAIFRRRQVGLIYQFYNLIPVLNVEENMTLPCELDGRQPDPGVVRELAYTLGLEKRLGHLPNELSGGQQQRVAIGRALITRPAILLADEPTGNLDSRASDEIMTLLREANQKYKQTIIMITHNQELAKQAHRVLTIEDGRIQEGRAAR